MTVKKETTPEINFSDHESTFSLSFSYFCRLFSAKANFFSNLFLLLKFFLFFISRKQTNFGVPWEGTILFFCPSGWALLSLGRIFVLRDGPFEFFWFTQTSFFVHQKNSKGPSLRTKILPRDNKAQPSGQKQYCTLPRDTKICLFPLEKKKKIEQQKKICKKNWPWQKKVCKKMKKTMKKWIRGPKILSRWSFPFSRSQLPIKEPLHPV